MIGTGAVVLPKVVIGENSVIAAGAVVTRSVPSSCMAAGNPAKILKNDICRVSRRICIEETGDWENNVSGVRFGPEDNLWSNFKSQVAEIFETVPGACSSRY